MQHPLAVTGSDLDQWSNRLDARATMPRLIRRLIQASARRVYRIGFPADEGTQLGGFDGIVLCDGAPPYVPDGQSAWEIGTNKDIKGKADEDYEKRKQDTLGTEPAKTTYVFVTSRRWARKQAWEQARRKEGFWRDVRVLDADDLEAWLEQEPVVHRWLARLMGKRGDGMLDLSESWELWSNRTAPAVCPDLILAGRSDVADHLRTWLAGPPSLQRLRADEVSEAVAFFAAFTRLLPEGERVGLQVRTLIVSTPAAFRDVISHRQSLVLIPEGGCEGLSELAVNHGHHVLVPVGSDAPPAAGDLSLPHCQRREAEAALRKMGIPEDRARDLAQECKGRLNVLLRLLSRGRTAATPAWSKPEEALALMPLLLAGAWNGASAADRAVVERLASGRTYADLEHIAVRRLSGPDSPLQQIGTAWQWVSRDDAWHHLGRFVTKDALDAFQGATIEVLGMQDPRYDMPPGERWMAGMKGKALPVSGFLRKALAETLAIIATRDDLQKEPLRGQARAEYVVRCLLGDDADWRRWVSLSGLLPELAESAPDAFLEAVEDRLLAEPYMLAAMFEQEGDMGGSPHTGLLWALETLAWDPQRLTQVTVLLGRLSARDPGGRLANRPGASLREVFLSWRPQTCAALDQRLQAIDVLAANEPDAAWGLVLGLIPQRAGECSHLTRKPRWRDWHVAWTEGVTTGEYQQTVEALSGKLLAWVGTDGERWVQLLDALPRQPKKFISQAVRSLAAVSRLTLPDTDRARIWQALRDVLHFQRLYARSARSLSDHVVASLGRLYHRLTPGDPQQCVAWLFTPRPQLPDIAADDWREQQAAVEKARAEAVRLIVERQGLGGLLALAGSVEQPAVLGWTVGHSDTVNDEALADVLDHAVGSGEGNVAVFGSGAITGRFRRNGWAWAQAFCREGRGKEWPAEKRAAFACGLPHTSATWDLVSSWGPAAEETYWRTVRWHFVEEPGRDGERAVERLVQTGRPWAALDMAGLLTSGPGAVRLPSSLLTRVLETAAASEPAAEGRQPDSHAFHGVEGVFEALEASDEASEDTMARLEWLWLPLLRHGRRGLAVLHRALGKHPEFFVEVLGLVYRSEKEPEAASDGDEQTRARARQAWELLHEWRSVPGASPDGTLDGESLAAWVDAARAACAAQGHAVMGDQTIGGVLAYAPPGADGAWPHEAVRAVIERVGSRQLERGLEIGVFNKRGVVARLPEEGGRLERELAARYRAHASTVAVRFRRTAAVLARIAGGYEEDGRREDVSSEMNDYL